MEIYRATYHRLVAKDTVSSLVTCGQALSSVSGSVSITPNARMFSLILPPHSNAFVLRAAGDRTLTAPQAHGITIRLRGRMPYRCTSQLNDCRRHYCGCLSIVVVPQAKHDVRNTKKDIRRHRAMDDICRPFVPVLFVFEI